MLLTTHVTVIESQYVTVRICHAELKKLLTYLLGGETFLGWNVQGQTDKGAKRNLVIPVVLAVH